MWVSTLDNNRESIKKACWPSLHSSFTLILIRNSIHRPSEFRQGVFPELNRASTCTEAAFAKSQYKAGYTQVSVHSITAKNTFQAILQKVNRNHTCSKFNFTNLSGSRTQMTFNRFATQSTPPPSPPPSKSFSLPIPSDFILACCQWILQ